MSLSGSRDAPWTPGKFGAGSGARVAGTRCGSGTFARLGAGGAQAGLRRPPQPGAPAELRAEPLRSEAPRKGGPL